MAPIRALAALAVLSGFAVADAALYSYVNAGQEWGTIPKANATNAACTALNLPGGALQANGYPACLVSVDNSACTTTASSIQSPIDIPTGDTAKVVHNTTLKALDIKYGTTTSWTMEVQSNYLEVADIVTGLSTAGDGTSADATASGSDGLTLPDGSFLPLNQFHMHTPSENTIDGEYYPMEMHLVHKAYTNLTTLAPIPASSCPAGTPDCHLAKAAVIGVMFDLAATDNAWVAKLIASLTGGSAPAVTAINGTGVYVDAANVANGAYKNTVTAGADMFSLMSEVFTAAAADPAQYFSFMGSLTTPGSAAGPKGCQEGLYWHVLAKPVPISAAQLNVFTTLLASQQGGTSRGADNRLTQPLNARVVQASFDPRPAVSSAPKAALVSAALMLSVAALAL